MSSAMSAHVSRKMSNRKKARRASHLESMLVKVIDWPTQTPLCGFAVAAH